MVDRTMLNRGRRIAEMLSRLLTCTGLALLAVPGPVWSCTTTGIMPPLELVRTADLIVRARATGYAQAPSGRPAPFGGPSTMVKFTVLEVLRGGDAPGSLQVAGILGERDDFNDRPVPYDFVRRGGRGGSCFATEYRDGAEFLLFLKKEKDGYTPYWGRARARERAAPVRRRPLAALGAGSGAVSSRRGFRRAARHSSPARPRRSDLGRPGIQEHHQPGARARRAGRRRDAPHRRARERRHPPHAGGARAHGHRHRRCAGSHPDRARRARPAAGARRPALRRQQRHDGALPRRRRRARRRRGDARRRRRHGQTADPRAGRGAAGARRRRHVPDRLPAADDPRRPPPRRPGADARRSVEPVPLGAADGRGLRRRRPRRRYRGLPRRAGPMSTSRGG